MYIQDENELAQLLREAAEAHNSFESTLGHPDQDWSEWYAKRNTSWSNCRCGRKSAVGDSLSTEFPFIPTARQNRCLALDLLRRVQVINDGRSANCPQVG